MLQTPTTTSSPRTTTGGVGPHGADALGLATNALRLMARSEPKADAMAAAVDALRTEYRLTQALAHRLAECADAAGVHATVNRLLTEDLGAERSALLRITPAGHEWFGEKVRRDYSPQPGDIVAAAMAGRRPVASSDRGDWPGVDADHEQFGDPCLALPLIGPSPGGELLGALVVGGPHTASVAGRSLLAALADVAALALGRVNREDAVRVAAAADAVSSLREAVRREYLPEVIPVVPGVTVSGKVYPASPTSGHVYDFVTDGGGNLSVMLAQASGRDVQASVSLAICAAALRSHASEGRLPGIALRAVNAALFPTLSRSGRLVVAQQARFDPRVRRLVVSGAGSHPPLHYRRADRAVAEIRAGGVVLGVMQDSSYEQTAASLSPGDHVLFYSDAVVSARGPDGERLGSGRLRQVMLRTQDLSNTQALETVADAVRQHTRGEPQRDDVVLLLLSIDAAGSTQPLS